ncbi:echinoderm microtubule-associated protein-like elp-1 [Anaeramoeba flamelloides]|uniref:Echinoderm microtubule-associated protein-like elp-1 n=1 Tax=Anaeramoeba flamelloides TaxID=1746091 RepID=A0ABQ8Y5T3_9EUKA|nr:echinoderm microtubule-associated protein-like elp-1 [Anaeramoeba flamelloides]
MSTQKQREKKRKKIIKENMKRKKKKEKMKKKRLKEREKEDRKLQKKMKKNKKFSRAKRINSSPSQLTRLQNRPKMNKFKKWISFTLIQGKDFPKLSLFCEIMSFGNQKYKSKVNKHKPNPNWNQTFLFGLIEFKPITVKIYNSSTSFNQESDSVLIDISTLDKVNEIKKWFDTEYGAKIEAKITIVTTEKEYSKKEMEFQIKLNQLPELFPYKSNNNTTNLKNTTNNFKAQTSSKSRSSYGDSDEFTTDLDSSQISDSSVSENQSQSSSSNQTNQLKKKNLNTRNQNNNNVYNNQNQMQINNNTQIGSQTNSTEKSIDDLLKDLNFSSLNSPKPKRKDLSSSLRSEQRISQQKYSSNLGSSNYNVINRTPKMKNENQIQKKNITQTKNHQNNNNSYSFELEFVYGYNGDDRNNIYCTKNKEVIFYAAAIGIVYNLETKKQKFFLGHSQSITCLAVHPNRKVVATAQAGPTPMILIWDTKTCTQLACLPVQNQDGIASISFAKKSTLIVTVGLDSNHTVSLWDWNQERLLSSAVGAGTKSLNLQFVGNRNDLFVVTGINHIQFWSISQNYSLKVTPGIFDKNVDGMLLSLAIPNESTVLTGSRSGHIIVWSTHSFNITQTVKAHVGPCYALNIARNGDILSGGKDGKVNIFDGSTYSKKYFIKSIVSGPIRALDLIENTLVTGSQKNQIWLTDIQTNKSSCEIFSHSEEVHGLACHQQSGQFLSMSDDRSVRLWDTKMKKSVGKLTVNGQPRIGTYSNDGELVAIGLRDGEFIVATRVGLKVKTNKKDTTCPINLLKFSPNSRLIGICYSNGTVGIYDSSVQFRRISRFKINNPVALDWSTDSQSIRVFSSSERKCWNVHEFKPIHENKAQWESNTGLLTLKIPNFTSSDIRNNLLATFSTNKPYIKVSPFPPDNKNKPIYMKGHGSQVKNVKLMSSTHLISAGGQDRCVFQWKKK